MYVSPHRRLPRFDSEHVEWTEQVDRRNKKLVDAIIELCTWLEGSTFSDES
jgi:hypothetical protein